MTAPQQARDLMDDWLARNTEISWRGRVLAVTEIVDSLTDAGLVITADADGSEHPGAHALRAAADEIDLPGYDAQGYYSGNGAHGYHQAEGHAATYLRTRAAELEGN